jgi:hypothetical protein
LALKVKRDERKALSLVQLNPNPAT